FKVPNGQERLYKLGSFLIEITSMSLSDFTEFVRIQVWGYFSKSILLFQNELKIYDEQPEYWANDIRLFIDTLEKSLPGNRFLIPCDLPLLNDSNDAMELVRRLIFNFGRLLQWWPGIVSAAKGLRSQGYSMARPV
ncbi:MAG: hypothetical protein ACRD8U_13795, partial [Pyrinomonadaceae bacterium]